MKKYFLTLITLSTFIYAKAQDTFSICAVDAATGQVGSAGATCISSASVSAIIISDVHPGVGVVHTQSYWVASNQNYARTLMNSGTPPQQIIDSLIANDVDFSIRQYGVVDLNGGTPRSAGFTGIDCMDYKNHITGPGYSIQGNILLGQQILDSMESRFLNTTGSLACRLMAAMQGAKVIGADTRCATNGISSFSAFLRVANPGDLLTNLFLDLNVNTYPNHLEPIDSLQVLFDNAGGCLVGINENETGVNEMMVSINPNEAMLEIIFGNNISDEGCELKLTDITGRTLQTVSVVKGKSKYSFGIKSYAAGIYIIDAVTSKSKKHFSAKASLN